MPEQFDLFEMEFDEVSLVPSGDNPGAEIVLSKAAQFSAHKTGQKSGGGRHHQDGWRNTPHVFKDNGSGSCKLCDNKSDFSIHKSDPAPITLGQWISIHKEDRSLADFVQANMSKSDGRRRKQSRHRDNKGRFTKSGV